MPIETLKPFKHQTKTQALSAYELVTRRAVEDLEREIARIDTKVNALVVGMETENGFRELIRRVGTERAKVQRFGKGYNVWNPPAGEQIEAVAKQSGAPGGATVLRCAHPG